MGESNDIKATGLEELKADSKDNELNYFIWDLIREDIAEDGQMAGKTVHTRFPPEPNGCLHIGHAKAIVVDFGTAEKFGGVCNLRMDDTNPVKEDTEFVDAIKRDIHWLGYDFGDNFFYASDYFEKMYQYAEELIQKGLAFVCEMTAEEIKNSRGTLTEPGKESPYRNRPISENLSLFRRMRQGEFPDGSMTLRAKIDMAAGNINMRDPVIYRISHTSHHRTGNKWCIYPMYDFAHPLEDAIEGITHSLCSLEFEDHRPLYEWIINNTSVPAKPRQIEFARLNVTYTVMSKRKLSKLIADGIVDGWDDPRMPTISGLRRRGYTPESIRDFCERNGVSKVISTVDFSFLEHCLREDLNARAPRAMAVLKPLKLTITNYPEAKVETMLVDDLPNKENSSQHEIYFSRHLLIEQGDFMENPPKKYYRLFPGNKVRLRGAYIVTCTGCRKDASGNVVEVFAEYDPETRGGIAPTGEKVRGTIHFLEEGTAKSAEVRLYDRLFTVENPDADAKDYLELINPESVFVEKNVKVEPWLVKNHSEIGFQFMRHGYFIHDCKDSSDEHLVFNRSVSLKDSYKPKS